MVLQITQFTMFVVVRCDRIKVERVNNNNANKLDAPLVVMHELIKVALWHFILDVLNMYRPHLDRLWSEEDINEIEGE